MKYERYGKEKQADLNLYVCGKDENLQPGVRYGPVIRDSYIIECCTGGYGSAIINGIEFPVQKGDCIILLPGDVIIHTASETEPREGVWCGVNGIKIGKYLNDAGITSKTPYAPREAFEKITEQISNILKMSTDNDAGAELRRGACIHALFGEIMRYAKKDTDSDLYIKKALHIMELKYSENIKVSDIASELSLERSYFQTIFKNSTGIAPYKYLTELRIKKACALLSDKTLSVSEVAQAVGIEPINFARVFKKSMGISPGEYRKKL